MRRAVRFYNRCIGEIFRDASTQFGIMMCAINLPAREPPDSTSNKRVGREVFLPANTRKRNRRRGAVCKDFCERSGVLMTYDTGDGPSGGRMVGRKRIAALPEFAVRGVDVRPLSAGRIV